MFASGNVLFGDIITAGELEEEAYHRLFGYGRLGILPIPTLEESDRYMTQIHSIGKAGAIAYNTKKFVECTAFLNYQSTHSTDILNTYYDYKLQYDVADGAKGTVYMLQYIRNNVRSSFDKTFEDAIGSFYSEQGADAQKWAGIFSGARYQIDIRASYQEHYQAKKEHLDTLVSYYNELP